MRIFLLAAILVACNVGAQAQHLVDVGGYRLDVLQAGKGNPTVVFEAGVTDSMTFWEKVFPHIAEYTSVVAYSRPGLGRSEPDPLPHTASRAVSTLHTLLAKLSLHPPYVLVGHSYGGLLMRLYASTYRTEVAGIVLVDGTHEQAWKRLIALDSNYSPWIYAMYDSLTRVGTPSEAAELKEIVRILKTGTTEEMKPLPDVPIAILTSTKTDSVPAAVSRTARGKESVRAGHSEWAQNARTSIHIVTDRSGHYIQTDEPQLVIDAIRFVLDRVRAR